MTRRLDATSGHIEMRFPYFVMKAAPVSGVKSMMNYETSLTGEVHDDRIDMWISVVVPVTSLCPCSKAISEYGAHNQRSHVIVSAVYADPAQADIDSLIQMVEKQASSELWGLLKRTDEKYVTEHAYDNPKFVEDLVRDVAVQVKAVQGVTRFRVSAENFESIHNHSAYAVVEG